MFEHSSSVCFTDTAMKEKIPSFSHESLPVDESVSLRALAPEDAEALFDLVVDNREYLAKFLPWANDVRTVNDSREFIAGTANQRVSGEEFGFGIIADGAVVGHASLMHLKDGKVPEIGYWIAESHSGKGIVTKSAEALTKFGLDTLGLDRVIIRARPDNMGSNAIPEKLGYKFEGVVEDEVGVDGVHNVWTKAKI
jgi:ribosomal-protein-serine acetyltransferase